MFFFCFFFCLYFQNKVIERHFERCESTVPLQSYLCWTVELKLKAVVFSLRTPHACCFVADCVLTETRDRGQTECDNSPSPRLALDMGVYGGGEDVLCDKVSRTEGEWVCVSLIV